MNIGILGGTFDPIHQGHLSLARKAQDQFALDQVLFIPASISPLKTQSVRITPAPERYRMVELALKGIENWEVCDCELTREGVSYTVDTLRELKKRFPDDKLFLILGADSLESFSAWREPEEILRLADLLVARRPGIDVKSPFASRAKWIEMPEIPISASEIREKIRKGKTLPEGVLVPEVFRYINQHHLYV